MAWHDGALAIIAFLSELIGTISGFGSSTFFVPFAMMVESFHFALLLTAFLHIVGNGSKIILFRQFLRMDLFWRFAVPSIVLCAAGAYVGHFIPQTYFKIPLGVLLLVLGVFFLLPKHVAQRFFRFAPRITIAMSGFLTGLFGTGGALRGAALLALKIPKAEFVALSAAIDIGGDLLRGAIYLSQGYWEGKDWFYLPLLLMSGFLGSWIGKKIIHRISQQSFERLVAVAILLTGLATLSSR